MTKFNIKLYAFIFSASSACFAMQQATTQNQTDATPLQTIAAAAAAQVTNKLRPESPGCPCCHTGKTTQQTRLTYTREQLLAFKDQAPTEEQKKLEQGLQANLSQIQPDTPKEKE